MYVRTLSKVNNTSKYVLLDEISNHVSTLCSICDIVLEMREE